MIAGDCKRVYIVNNKFTSVDNDDNKITSVDSVKLTLVKSMVASV